jgi:hypothetical protein
MHDKKIYDFMQKKSTFHQIKYLNYAKSKIKLKKATYLLVPRVTFVMQLKICAPTTDK